MKFIHTADIHWGMIPDSDKPWSRERAQAIKDTGTGDPSDLSGHYRRRQGFPCGPSSDLR